MCRGGVRGSIGIHCRRKKEDSFRVAAVSRKRVYKTYEPLSLERRHSVHMCIVWMLDKGYRESSGCFRFKKPMGIFLQKPISLVGWQFKTGHYYAILKAGQISEFPFEQWSDLDSKAFVLGWQRQITL